MTGHLLYGKYKKVGKTWVTLEVLDDKGAIVYTHTYIR